MLRSLRTAESRRNRLHTYLTSRAHHNITAHTASPQPHHHSTASDTASFPKAVYLFPTQPPAQPCSQRQCNIPSTQPHSQIHLSSSLGGSSIPFLIINPPSITYPSPSQVPSTSSPHSGRYKSTPQEDVHMCEGYLNPSEDI